MTLCPNIRSIELILGRDNPAGTRDANNAISATGIQYLPWKFAPNPETLSSFFDTVHFHSLDKIVLHCVKLSSWNKYLEATEDNISRFPFPTSDTLWAKIVWQEFIADYTFEDDLEGDEALEECLWLQSVVQNGLRIEKLSITGARAEEVLHITYGASLRNLFIDSQASEADCQGGLRDFVNRHSSLHHLEIEEAEDGVFLLPTSTWVKDFTATKVQDSSDWSFIRLHLPEVSSLPNCDTIAELCTSSLSSEHLFLAHGVRPWDLEAASFERYFQEEFSVFLRLQYLAFELPNNYMEPFRSRDIMTSMAHWNDLQRVRPPGVDPENLLKLTYTLATTLPMLKQADFMWNKFAAVRTIVCREDGELIVWERLPDIGDEFEDPILGMGWAPTW